MAQQNPYLLACDNPSALLELLSANPSIASCQDESGYSLLHAAASYGHADLLRVLVKDYNVDVNLLDEDGDTCLFVAEDAKIARCLVEELGVDYKRMNFEGLKAHEKLESEGEFPQVSAYLREVLGEPAPAPTDSPVGPLNPPGPIPANIKVNIGTMTEQEASAGETAVDPEFKRRIDELAARDDFHSEATQAQLRELVMEAISGSQIETATESRAGELNNGRSCRILLLSGTFYSPTPRLRCLRASSRLSWAYWPHTLRSFGVANL